MYLVVKEMTCKLNDTMNCVWFPFSDPLDLNGSYFQTYFVFVFMIFLVPDYLRTKYDPEIEESEQKLETMATSIPPDQAQVYWQEKAFTLLEHSQWS